IRGGSEVADIVVPLAPVGAEGVEVEAVGILLAGVAVDVGIAPRILRIATEVRPVPVVGRRRSGHERVEAAGEAAVVDLVRFEGGGNGVDVALGGRLPRL